MDKDYVQGEAMKGMAMGTEIVERWKEKFKLKMLFRIAIIGLVIWLIVRWLGT